MGGERKPFSFFVSISLSERGKSCGKDNKDYEFLTADYGVYKYIYENKLGDFLRTPRARYRTYLVQISEPTS